MTTPKTDPLATRASLLGRLRDWSDDAAWAEFNRVYGRLLFNFAIKLGVPERDAQDVVQETLTSVAKSIRAFEYDPERSSFKTWLLSVARRRVADFFRRRELPTNAAHRSISTDHPRTGTAERIPDPSGQSPETVWTEEWQHQVLDLALERLKVEASIKHFQIFFLRVIKQQSVTTVSAALGVSSGQVYLVTHRLKGTFTRLVSAAERDLDAPTGTNRAAAS